VHTPREAADAGDVVDYLVAGTVFPTASKAPDAPLLGVEGLRAIVAAARVPVLAIGGITLDRLDAIAGAGAAGVAGISLFDGCAPVREIARAIRARFDSANTAS
jgi:thiamine-phosphate pyrophosphorylase